MCAETAGAARQLSDLPAGGIAMEDAEGAVAPADAGIHVSAVWTDGEMRRRVDAVQPRAGLAYGDAGGAAGHWVSEPVTASRAKTASPKLSAE
jgi:hypothetical protein